jgi:hypothetical protein
MLTWAITIVVDFHKSAGEFSNCFTAIKLIAGQLLKQVL